jgi:hypothetical protein
MLPESDIWVIVSEKFGRSGAIVKAERTGDTKTKCRKWN